MGRSQPAVSQQIQSLQSEMDVTLFVRRGSKMQLTREGALLFEMAMPLIEQLERLDEQFNQRRSETETGCIEVAAGWSTILYVLPKYVEKFRHTYPKIELHLHNVTGAEGLEQLRSGVVDFAVGPWRKLRRTSSFIPLSLTNQS